MIASSSPSIDVTRMPFAPQTSARSAKSGLCSEVCHTSRSAARCSLLILPSSALFMTTWVMSMPYFTAVVSSIAYWPKPPSPEIDTTGRPANAGCDRVAAQHPIAAGNEKPMEPR